MFANIAVEYFIKGGWVMWPILAAALVTVAIIGERTFWWARLQSSRSPKIVEQVFTAVERGDFEKAKQTSNGSTDPVVRTLGYGLKQHHSSLQGALQIAAGAELQHAGRCLTALDTMVTLAPLLGLLGTVSGIFRTFLAIGNASVEGAMAQVTGGIGEALIATMCGLGIAIVALIPLNYFTSRHAQLQFELEAAATNLELMVNAARSRAPQTA
jgi:biopolymer transport protein ExbB